MSWYYCPDVNRSVYGCCASCNCSRGNGTAPAPRKNQRRPTTNIPTCGTVYAKSSSTGTNCLKLPDHPGPCGPTPPSSGIPFRSESGDLYLVPDQQQILDYKAAIERGDEPAMLRFEEGWTGWEAITDDSTPW